MNNEANPSRSAILFFRNVQAILTHDDLCAENQKLSNALADLDQKWRYERDRAQVLEQETTSPLALTKRLLMAVMHCLPWRLQPLAGRFVRLLWPGFARA